MLCCKVCDVSYHPFCLPQYQWSQNSQTPTSGSGNPNSHKKSSHNPYARVFYEGQSLTENMVSRKMDNARLQVRECKILLI